MRACIDGVLYHGQLVFSANRDVYMHDDGRNLQKPRMDEVFSEGIMLQIAWARQAHRRRASWSMLRRIAGAMRP